MCVSVLRERQIREVKIWSLEKGKWGTVLLHLIRWKLVKTHVYFDFATLSFFKRRHGIKLRCIRIKLCESVLQQFCANSLQHPKLQADQWKEQGRGTVQCGCYDNLVLIGIRLRNHDSSLTLHFLFPFLTGSWRFAVLGVSVLSSQVTEIHHVTSCSCPLARKAQAILVAGMNRLYM